MLAARRPGARDGLARALALPPRGGAGRRRLLAQARTLGGHRRRAASRPRVRARDRALRRSAVRRRRRSTSSSARASPRLARPSSSPRSLAVTPLGTLDLVRPDRDAILKALEQVIDPELRAARDRARHGAGRPRRGRRLRLGHDRAHRRRLPASRLVPGAGGAIRGRGAGGHSRAARLRRDDARREGRARRRDCGAGVPRTSDLALAGDTRDRRRLGEGRCREVDPDREPCRCAVPTRRAGRGSSTATSTGTRSRTCSASTRSRSRSTR